MARSALVLLAALILPPGAPALLAAGPAHLVLGDTEVPVQVYPAEGDRLVLWLPSEHGVVSAHDVLSQALARGGIESWVADLFAAYFLPAVPTSLDEIPVETLAALIEAAHEVTGKTVYLASNDRGAALALHGAQEWQLAHPGDDALGGAILITPYLLAGTPEVGAEAEYLPIAEATNLPLFLIQPARSPTYWRVGELAARLEEGGSSVFLRSLAEARDRFFFRPDAMATELELTRALPVEIAGALRLLATQPRQRAAIVAAPSERPAVQARAERLLEPFTGDPTPPPLRLADLQGRMHDLADYRGEVVLINFWASWCPPCVHEMPSMQALADRLDPERFEILAVNLAEEPGPIRGFVEDLGLRFSVLLDPAGEAITTWRVFAYPTSYVIDRQGRVRYALFGSIDWMDAPTVATIEALINE